MSRFLLWLHLIAIVWLSDLNGPISVRAKPKQKPEGLYSSHDDVIVLNGVKLKERVYGTNMVWMIEFYNSWCGHCINFAPTWKQLASDMKAWRRVVTIGAVDCASDENLQVCRDYDIGAYPSIKLFPPGFTADHDKGKLTAVGTFDLQEITLTVLKYVTNPQFTPPATWPRLKPLRSLGDIWDEAKEEHKFVVVVFEEENSLVGRKVILDLVDFPSLLVRTMVKKDVEKFGTFTYPSLYIINRDSSFQLLASGRGVEDEDRHSFVDKLLSLLHFKDKDGKPIQAVDHLKDSKTNQVGKQVKGDGVGGKRDQVVHFERDNVSAPVVASPSVGLGVHMRDLESSLHYAFRQEIAICKTIDGPKLDALRNFVSTLAKYFPGRVEVLRFLWKLVEFLRKQDVSLTGDSWVRAIDKLQDKEAYLPDQIHWVGCQGSQPRYRGYPCGMWTLFHTLTVAAYESKGVNAMEVPFAIRDYMEHFFGCHECSKNFLKMASSMERDIHKPLQAVLWLWAAHNRANKRLHGDASEDPQHPKIQFPSSDNCPHCHSQLKEGDSPGWNSSAVTLFLIHLYSKDSIIQDAAASSIEEEGEWSKVKNKEEMDWWEKQQRQIDLKKIRDLRKEKKQQKLEKKLALQMAEQSKGDKSHGDRGRGNHKRHDTVNQETIKGRRLGEGWGLNTVDVGVCVVFYVSCAVIILILYYHFIVHRRHRLPCSNYLPL